MTRLEQIEFESKEKFMTALNIIFNGEDSFRSYESKGETKKKKIISKGTLYLGNNHSISIKEASNKKVYVSVNYFSVDNRFDIAKKKNTTDEV